ncbi:MAG: peroxiredoxin family protein [Silvanigrellaceae bacterium]
MNSLATLAQRAGLHTLDSNVVIPNFQFPVVSSLEDEAGRPAEPLFCDQRLGLPADITLLYFTLPDCENCRPGARAVERLMNSWDSPGEQPAPKVCARVVVSDWPTLPEVVQEFKDSGFKNIPGLVWDSQGVLNERLAVVAQPAFYLLDRGGQLLAYQNGVVEFSTPGFELFWKSLRRELKEGYRNGDFQKLGETFNAERTWLSSQPVSFLNQGLLSAFWLVVLCLLCYSLVRYLLRLRKNLSGSEN